MKMWKVYRQTDGQTDRQTDDRWSEKLTWAFSSVELKRINTPKKRYLAKFVKLLQAFMSPPPPLTNEGSSTLIKVINFSIYIPLILEMLQSKYGNNLQCSLTRSLRCKIFSAQRKQRPMAISCIPGLNFGTMVHYIHLNTVLTCLFFLLYPDNTNTGKTNTNCNHHTNNNGNGNNCCPEIKFWKHVHNMTIQKSLQPQDNVQVAYYCISVFFCVHPFSPMFARVSKS